MLQVVCTIDIESEKWDSDAQKKVFMGNAEYVIQRGLEMMNVPDWTVTVEDIKEL